MELRVVQGAPTFCLTLLQLAQLRYCYCYFYSYFQRHLCSTTYFVEDKARARDAGDYYRSRQSTDSTESGVGDDITVFSNDLARIILNVRRDKRLQVCKTHAHSRKMLTKRPFIWLLGTFLHTLSVTQALPKKPPTYPRTPVQHTQTPADM